MELTIDKMGKVNKHGKMDPSNPKFLPLIVIMENGIKAGNMAKELSFLRMGQSTFIGINI
jgi:hypothetical protein